MDKYVVNFIALVSILFCYQIAPLHAAPDGTARGERFSSVFISDHRIERLKEAVEKKSTDAFSYFEILNARWPNPHAIKLLRESRPMTVDQSAPFLTFTHGQLLLDEK